MQDLLFRLLFVLTGFFVLTQFVIVYIIFKAMARHKQDHLVDHAIAPETRAKSQEIIHDAIIKADDIVSQAELSGLKVLAKEKLEGKDLGEEYRKHLLTIEKAFEDEFSTSSEAAKKAYTDFIKELEGAMQKHVTGNEQLLVAKADEMIAQTKKLLNDLTTDVQKRVRTQVDEELSSASKEINEYKLRRMKMIDERIITMLEDVIRVTLEKKLSLVEQSELVYRALEEAKKENAFK